MVLLRKHKVLSNFSLPEPWPRLFHRRRAKTHTKKGGGALTAVGFLVLMVHCQRVTGAARVRATRVQRVVGGDATWRRGCGSILDGKQQSTAKAVGDGAAFGVLCPLFALEAPCRPRLPRTTTTMSRWPRLTKVVRRGLDPSCVCIAIASHHV